MQGNGIRLSRVNLRAAWITLDYTPFSTQYQSRDEQQEHI